MEHRLQILPGNIANMIAAGEVVQRPSSVVKEMMENAVDAGATSVDVIISDSGRTLIQVIDNGCGMSAQDARLCFERHATSKIASAEDLENILTFGFRGEALASIAAVSEITLKTRRKEDETGTLIRINGSGQESSEEVSTPVGSNFAVRNLFYNTPARRKFLKSDNVEFKHIVEEFLRVALTRPAIAFSLKHNGRDIYTTRAAKSVKFRIMDLVGSGVTEELVDIDTKTSVVNISGYLGRPDSARKTLGNQYFFLNGRYFRSAYLHKAVMKAYEEFIPAEVTPSYFLFLEADPHSVDINIHPTKTEIKFEDDSLIFQTIFAAVKATLGKNSFGASIDFDAASAIDLPVLGRNYSEYRPVAAPSIDFDPDYNPFDATPEPAAPAAPQQSGTASGYHAGSFQSWDNDNQDYSKLFEEKAMPSTQVMVFRNKYILAPAMSGLMAVHIRRARERVLYERFLDALSREGHISQSTLFPVQVKLSVPQVLLLEDRKEELRKLGFAITVLGDDSVVVEGVPEGYSCEAGKVREMMDKLLLVLSDGTTSIGATMQADLARKMAVCGAAEGGAGLSQIEAQRLLEALLACENAEYTATGEKIINIIPLETIENRF